MSRKQENAEETNMPNMIDITDLTEEELTALFVAHGLETETDDTEEGN